MYISLSLLFKSLFGILAFAALVLLIVLLVKTISLVTSATKLIKENSSSINKACKHLPAITENAADITESVKGIADVATEATAEAIVAKDNFLSNFETIKDIVSIILSIFSK